MSNKFQQKPFFDCMPRYVHLDIYLFDIKIRIFKHCICMQIFMLQVTASGPLAISAVFKIQGFSFLRVKYLPLYSITFSSCKQVLWKHISLIFLIIDFQLYVFEMEFVEYKIFSGTNRFFCFVDRLLSVVSFSNFSHQSCSQIFKNRNKNRRNYVHKYPLLADVFLYYMKHSLIKDLNMKKKITRSGLQLNI